MEQTLGRVFEERWSAIVNTRGPSEKVKEGTTAWTTAWTAVYEAYREEIKKILSRPDLGITDVTWVALGGRKTRLFFRIDRRLYRLDIHAPDTVKDPDKKFRRLHRGVAGLLKNIIAVAEEGLCGVGEILAAFMLTSDDSTVGESILRLEAGSTRLFTLALAPAETALVPTGPTGVAPTTRPPLR